jgi:16S rRNA (cytidine1402-2'-O)-methyltransferase
MTPTEAPVGRLVVCPTPIGNLEDVTLRVLATLRTADVVACEDTRHTSRLLERHGIATKAVSFHEHNERARGSELVQRITDGAVVALVSDAGTPLISDPGFALVQACLAADVPVEVLPGPSAVVTALVTSGLPAERWRFVGFLPRKTAEREQLLEHSEETLVAFESPRRLATTLTGLAALDPGRPLAVCRELTKIHEEVRRGSAAQLAEHYREHAARGEVVVVVGAAARSGAAKPEALAAARELVGVGVRVRTAAALVGKLSGVSVNELYRELTGSKPATTR